jgi:hypothetical protein
MTSGRLVSLRLILVAGACWGAGSCHGRAPAPFPGVSGPAPRPHAPVVTSRRLLESLAVIASGELPDGAATDRWAARVEAGPPGELARYVDALLDSPRFADSVLPDLVFKETTARVSLSLLDEYVLKRTAPGPDGRSVYYLRSPCRASEAELVVPWWAPKTEVLVCPDSHRPERFYVESAARNPPHCNSWYAASADPSRSCGCGPNLIRCYRDANHLESFVDSTANEIRKTVGYVHRHDLPASAVFTARETFRDRRAEAVYRRFRVELEQPRDALTILAGLEEWPEEGKWAPRHEYNPGQHAGVLTTPRMAYYANDRRSRLKFMFERLWCVEPDSVGATTAQLFELETANLQVKNEGWEHLAKKPLCTNCHARMDYGMQFFLGWGAPRETGMLYFPALQAAPGTTGAFYARDIGDLRGRGELNPRGFAELAVNQPEFKRCMAENVAEHVFGARVTREQKEELVQVFTATGTFRAVTRAALLEYANQWQHQPGSVNALDRTPEAPPMAVVQSSPPEAEVAVGGALEASLQAECLSCHDEPEPGDFAKDALPRGTVARMLAMVAFGRMPKDGTLDDRTRDRMVDELIQRLWTGSAERGEARAFYLGKMRPRPVHDIGTAMRLVEQRAGARSGLAFRTIETSIRGDQALYTPGFVALTALQALRACKAGGARGEALERCVQGSTRPSLLGLPDPAPAPGARPSAR